MGCDGERELAIVTWALQLAVPMVDPLEVAHPPLDRHPMEVLLVEAARLHPNPPLQNL